MWCWPTWSGIGLGGFLRGGFLHSAFVLLGLAALAGLAWILFRSLRRREPTAQAKGSCPACGSAVESAYFRCPECGRSLKTHCPSCSRVVEAPWSFCPYCSRELSAPAAINPQTPEGEVS